MSAKNTTSNNTWGISAIHQGQKLVFTGTFSAERIKKERWQKVWTGLFRQKFSAANSEANGIDIYNLFSPNAKQAWIAAFNTAKKRRGKVNLADIFLALLDEPAIVNLFKRMGAGNTGATKILLKNYLKLGTPADTGEELKKVPFEAYALAVRLHDHKIGSLMLLGAILILAPQNSILQAIFSNINLTLETLEILTVWQINLNYEFPPNSVAGQVLACCRQAELLEHHFGYLYEFSAIKTAVQLAQKQTKASLRQKTALGLLVKAGLLAQRLPFKTVTPELITKSSA
jgi:hypothetical protein